MEPHQFAESKLDRVTGGFCGILLNRLITAGSGGTAKEAQLDKMTRNNPSSL